MRVAVRDHDYVIENDCILAPLDAGGSLPLDDIAKSKIPKCQSASILTLEYNFDIPADRMLNL
eukprot:scaffold15872_cov145-Skeletonema_menzelii.AAC.15